jgi:sugar phosphate isomerase/epimerase
MKQTRREAIKTIGCLTAAPAIIAAMPKAGRYPIAFSTLGCPKWEWKTILNHASEWGYAAIELRGIQGEMDLTKRPEFTGDRLKESLKDLDALELRISDLGSSAQLHYDDSAKRTAQIDEAKRFIDLAQRLKAPYVRVFGNNIVKDQPKQASLDRIIAGLQELGRHAKGSGVGVLMETHGDFPDSPTVLQIMKGAAMPEVGVLWDAHHTAVTGKENPADTFKQLGTYVRHTHLKDSVQSGTEIHYVLTGKGTVPVRETVQVLVRNKYKGLYCFEWEKAWHPDIDEPDVAFPHYAKTVGGYLAEAGLKPA